MMTRTEVIDLMVLECNVCKHLYKQIPKSKLNYRPGKKMRSTIELLRYASFCGTECTRALLLDAFKTQDWQLYEYAEKKAASMKPEHFPAAMDRQIKDIRGLFRTITDTDLIRRRVTMPTGGTLPLGQAMMHTAYRFMSGYRMQLFLYAKASGNGKIGTKDCWFGKRK
jgi:hypothetical protein